MNVPETFFSVHEELVLFGLSCLFGIAIGICYDFFRALRLILPHNFWLVAAEDIIFLAGYAVFIISFSSAAARGQFRFYYIIGNAAGFTLYFMTLGSLVIHTLRKLLNAVFFPVKTVYVFLRKKAAVKFVGYSKLLKKNKKNFNFLLLKRSDLLYNKKENKKRKNVDFIAEKNKKKSE